MKIKILELIDGGFIGGGQTHILSICRNINKNEFDLSVSASQKGEFKNLVNSENYNFIDIYLPKIFRSKYLKNLENIVESGKFDIVHSHGGVAGVYSRFLKKISGNIKVLHTIHGIHYINSRNFFRNYLSKTLEQFLLPYADKYICVSDGDLKLALEHRLVLKEKTTVIKNGINLERFLNAGKNSSLKEEMGICSQDFIIGNISRFDYQKNQRFLINQIPEIIKVIPNAKFLFVGDGKYLSKAKSLSDYLGIKHKVIFTGEQKYVEKYYSLIDIFVFPSLWEGLSITLIEAMASGLCIMASDIPQNREIIKNNLNGILFSTSKVKNFLNSLFELYNSPEEREKLSTQAIIESNLFKEKDMTEKIQKIYKDLFYN